jgi:hypothetical protein
MHIDFNTTKLTLDNATNAAVASTTNTTIAFFTANKNSIKPLTKLDNVNVFNFNPLRVSAST